MLKKLLALDPSEDIDRIDFAFRGGWFLALVLITVAVAFAIYLYRSERHLPKGRRRVMMICQAGALLGLIIVLLQPYAIIRMTREFQRTFLLMLDTSRSMAFKDPRSTPAQVEEAARALNKVPLEAPVPTENADLQQSLSATTRVDLARGVLRHPQMKLVEQLRRNFDVRFFTFDGQVRPEEGPDAMAEGDSILKREATGDSSQLGSAIEEAVGRFSGQPVAGAMVFSDFAWMEGKDPLRVARQLKERGIPVYPVAIGLPAPPDIKLSGVVAPEVVFKGDSVPLRVKVESRGYQGRTVDLQLTIDGEQGAVQQVQLKDGVQYEEMTFIPQRDAGTINLKFQIAAVAGEATDLNNHTSHDVRIINEKIKVLYVEGLPRWEFRYLRWVLLRDPRLDVKFLMTQGDPALAGSSPRHIGRFPQDPAEALKFDLIIIGDVPASYFNATQTELIQQLVKERGGSLLMIAGPMAAPATYRETPLGEILPVNIGSTGFHNVAPTDSPEVTSAGRESLATSLSVSPEVSARVWANIKPMYTLPQLEGAKAGATVLLRLPKASEELPDYPLVAWHRYGTGKAMFVGTEDLWRMRLEVGDRFHARFWGQTIQFLTLSRLLGQNKQITLETDRGSYSTGEQVRIFANVLTESFEPVTRPSYDVILEANGETDTATTIELSPLPDTPGLFSGTHLAGKDGSYVIRTRPADSEISNQSGFKIATQAIEDRETAMQPDVARQIAELSGGRELALASLGTFPASLGEEKKLTSVVRLEKDLWDVPIWFLIVVAFAGVEWYLRRKDNLV
ncbi:MAG: hypothetical protein ACKV19_02195 [Verrucomicrobiales bacterium]